MRLLIPPTARPQASVVVVTFGAWGWAERAFRALVEHTWEPYELIVVDNGSGPGLLRRLEESVSGARVIRNPGNVGFGPACNQGAAAARGRHLVFLNSDALVTPGWLGPLMARAEAGAGAVGPMLLNLDGSLQEAGAAVWRGGETDQTGAGDDPGLPEHGFPRVVDYVSGACMAVRRAAFEAVGGFDPAYAPAYSEDVDLCFALAARGMPAVYEPRSRVVHARGASSPKERALALVLRNRAIFRSRWRSRLAGRPELPVPLERRDLLALRDAVASVRILVLADRVPEPGDPAGRLIGAIARGWPDARVSLVAPEAGGPLASASMRDLGVEAVPGAGAGWLAERAGHYDVVVSAGRSDGTRALEAAAAASQARAARI
ncbi:MAG: hypothetical protein QOD86_937, partial [Miltoncostaeaceae bacterium]|nr:hypothetical protein [Miltoncostaeaceae bacterium]